MFNLFCLQELFLFLLTMQSYDGFRLIPNFFFHFSSKALDKRPDFGQIPKSGPYLRPNRSYLLVFFVDAASTVTLTVSENFPSTDFTVMTALPAATAVTVPELLTVAILVFDDDHVSVLALEFVSFWLRSYFSPALIVTADSRM